MHPIHDLPDVCSCGEPWDRCQCPPTPVITAQQRAEAAFPDHHPATALANYRAGREVWDTNGDMW